MNKIVMDCCIVYTTVTQIFLLLFGTIDRDFLHVQPQFVMENVAGFLKPASKATLI